MRPSWLKALVAGCMFLVVVVRSYAQPIFASAESIECTVANADRVVIARLVDFDGEDPADDIEGREARIAFEEVLKEDLFPSEHVPDLWVHLPYPASVLAEWKDLSHRLLVAVKEDNPTATRVINLTDENLEVLTADFQLLRDPEAVIQVAKNTVRRMPAAVRRIHTFPLRVPHDVVAGTKWESYSGLTLSVPVDERLEQRALDYLHSEQFLQRQEGVQALRHFKSAENIKRVKALLNDPGWAYLRRAEENNGLEVRIYGVRQEAYRTLKSWGVDVEKPLIREEIWKLDCVPRLDLSIP